ncbi:MAG: metallophosphatase domain-containing protein [Paracoccaceae bacterium]
MRASTDNVGDTGAITVPSLGFNWLSRKRSDVLSISAIADTHGRHRELRGLRGDILIHCGDMFDLFEQTPARIEDLDDWFAKQDFDLILCIGGNHDRQIEERVERGETVFHNAVYLADSGYEYRGVRFYGSPWVPDLRDHAFYAAEPELQRAWKKIPDNTDVLITHAPPFGVLDMSSRGQNLGCPHLTQRLMETVPRFHCFGHVHASGGTMQRNGTSYINAASVQSGRDKPLRKPVSIRITPKQQD